MMFIFYMENVSSLSMSVKNRKNQSSDSICLRAVSLIAAP